MLNINSQSHGLDLQAPQTYVPMCPSYIQSVFLFVLKLPYFAERKTSVPPEVAAWMGRNQCDSSNILSRLRGNVLACFCLIEGDIETRPMPRLSPGSRICRPKQLYCQCMLATRLQKLDLYIMSDYGGVEQTPHLR